MEKITVSKYNLKEAYAAFQTGKIAVAVKYDDIYFAKITYDDSSATGKGEKWSICAFGNMLFDLIYGKFDKIYIINPLDKNIFNTYEEMMQAVRENATHIIVKEEN